VENGTSQSGDPVPDKRIEPGIPQCYFIENSFRTRYPTCYQNTACHHYHFYMLAGAKGYGSGRRLLCDKTEVLWGEKIKETSCIFPFSIHTNDT
jgi:hypothetical protein